jgi:hypothetical protein
MHALAVKRMPAAKHLQEGRARRRGRRRVDALQAHRARLRRRYAQQRQHAAPVRCGGVRVFSV